MPSRGVSGDRNASSLILSESRSRDVVPSPETWDALRNAGAGERYLNFLTEGSTSDIHAAYGRDNLHRLVKLKNRYDPANTFHLNHNITPPHG